MTRTTIIGAGKFGGYFGERLTRLGHEVHYIDLTTADSVAHELLQRSDLVCLAVPISVLDKVLMMHAESIPDTAIVIDVCTVKIWPTEIMTRAFQGRRISVVATHPLFGPQSAPGPLDPAQHNVAICPIKGDLGGAIEGLFHQLGATIIHVTPEEHDRQQCQQILDHFVGRAALAAGAIRVPLSTKSHERFMGFVDIINGNTDQLFRDMNAYNPFARRFRSQFVSAVVRLHADLLAYEQQVIPHPVDLMDFNEATDSLYLKHGNQEVPGNDNVLIGGAGDGRPAWDFDPPQAPPAGS